MQLKPPETGWRSPTYFRFVKSRVPSLSNDGSRTKKASLNLVATALEEGAALIVSFVLTPLVVGYLGAALYGIWEVLRNLKGVLSPATGRATQALKWVIAQKQTIDDDREKQSWVGSAIVVWFLFLPILASAGAAVSWYIPKFLPVTPEQLPMVRLAAGLLCANLIVHTIAKVPRVVLEGENLGYKRMGLSVVVVLLGGMLTAVAIFLDLGLPGLAAALILATILQGVLYLSIVKKHVPWFGVRRPDRAIVASFARFSGWFISSRAVMQVMRNSDVLILGFFGAPENVAMYTLSRYLLMLAVRGSSLATLVSGPGIGGIVGAKEYARAASVRKEILAVTWFLLIVATATAVTWNRGFVSLWVAPEHYAGPWITLLLGLMTLQFGLIQVDASIINTCLKLRAKVLLAFAATVVSIGLSSALMIFFDLGIAGVCIGFLVGRLLMTVGYPVIVNRLLHELVQQILPSLLRPVLASTVLLTVATWASLNVSVSSWPALALSVGITAVAFAAFASYAGLSGDVRRQLIFRMSKLFVKTG